MLQRLVRQLPLLLLSPVLFVLDVVALWGADVAWALFGKKKLQANVMPRTQAASVVIPNWNGRDLLEKYLPSVVQAMAGHPDNEVIVVDNGSEDGSAEFLRERFPTVRVLAFQENLGFGGGSNAGFRAAKNDIVVLLNSDMRVAKDFLQPLLDGFDAADVFAVSCQIFFSDPNKVREETGLTQAWWHRGGLRVRHRIDENVTGPYPCFYGGGGSCAFDRAKFLELGGFDEVLKPFYLEDTDLGLMAWKRGWKVLYQPKSHVWHEHRGTIGKKFSQAYIQSVLKKNFAIFVWKNIHDPRMLAEHFVGAYGSAWLSVLFGDSPTRSNLAGLLKATLQLPGVIGARWRARQLAAVDDREAFRRPLGGYYRDRFAQLGAVPEKPKVLMVSPYGLAPASHGGAVFMQMTLRELSRVAEVHLIALLDEEWERGAHEELSGFAKSMQFLVRMTGQPLTAFSLVPDAVKEFANSDLEWMIHRTMLLEGIDVLQIEYTNMGQYQCQFERLVCAIFEHDVYFQSIARQMKTRPSLLWRIPAGLEYLKAFRWEMKMLEGVDLVQVCTPANEAYLLSLDEKLKGHTRSGMRAGIDTKKFVPKLAERRSRKLVFLGGFRHLPNMEALQWFFEEVAPILKGHGVQFEVVAIGADPPPAYVFPHSDGVLDLKGFVDDVRPYLDEAAVFLCPIRSGSGVRVKLLEAFALGVPVVSTWIGAEGLAKTEGEYCLLADDPHGFAGAIVRLLEEPEVGLRMAERARKYVEEEWDAEKVTGRLVAEYRRRLLGKRG